MSNNQGRAWLTGLLKVAGVVLLCLLSGVVGGGLTRHFGTSSYTLSYADFISIMLTAVSLLMTVLAIFLAVFGFVGWTTIEQKVHSKTEDFLTTGFEGDGRLMEMLNERMTTAADAKADEIMEIIEKRVVEETTYFSFMGVDPIDSEADDKDQPEGEDHAEGDQEK
ncbi:hypothetical protein ASE00_19435 [Sphingomonas sp. Root710]|uniref:hypothetical protein n=1 Tax=Sphingomonas sp. Root710 TaxID=1736594 RepID=UPI0006FE7321|nr:hypothetical protein [Sphingomonas sp. Root710]KRB79871.1 hypothetical protein ASE00_19435 [Sphingomonas sp. Root710]